MNKIPVWARYSVCVLVLVFAMMGATFAVHTSAKVFYGVLNVAVGAALVSTRLRSHQQA